MNTGIILNDEATWPADIISFLENRGNVFLAMDKWDYEHAGSFDATV